MSAKLVAYQYVPSGFEMLINDPNIEMGRVWNLWFNTKLTDDPESWDNEIIMVNKMQTELNYLSMDYRLIRAQIAEFCRLNPLFPRSVDLLCEQIGTGCFSEPMILGCEGRGLLRALGYHTPRTEQKQQIDVLNGYIQSLDRWLAQAEPQSLLDSKVYGFIGQRTDTKQAYLKKLCLIIDANIISISSLKKLFVDIYAENQGEFRLEEVDRPLSCLRCDGISEGETGPRCKCCYGMLIDAFLLFIGASNPQNLMYEEFNRFTQEYILTYCLAINSWLQAVPPPDVASITTTRYVTDNVGRQLALKVHASLGERNEVKEWLAACLLKTLKDNQRWHKRVELIDVIPEASSWFKNNKTA